MTHTVYVCSLACCALLPSSRLSEKIASKTSRVMLQVLLFLLLTEVVRGSVLLFELSVDAEGSQDVVPIVEGDSIEYSLHLFCMKTACTKSQFIMLLNDLRDRAVELAYFDQLDFGLPQEESHTSFVGAKIRYPTCLEFTLEKYTCKQQELFGDATVGGDYMICLDFIGNPLYAIPPTNHYTPLPPINIYTPHL